MSQNPQITVQEILEHGRQPGFKRELLRDAAAIIDGIPDEQFDMDEVYKDPNHTNPRDCGTVCCAIGWLSLHPGFQKLGLKPAPKTADFYLSYNGQPVDCAEAGAKLFGISEGDANFLFRPRGYDDWRARVPHKTVFRERVVWLLNAKQQQPAANSQG